MNKKEVFSLVQFLKNGNTQNIPIQEWYVESEGEVETIPTYVPAGSTVQILTPEGLTIKMKNSDDQWIEI